MSPHGPSMPQGFQKPNPALSAQQQASDPACSVWVNASAGSGKTKVLTDRFLRLLLQGTPAQKILCLTFTKAAAGEMTERLYARLLQWHTADEATLHNSLHALTGHPPTTAQLRLARGLYFDLGDQGQNLNIQTFHSFCQELLQRFSLEAGLIPGFQVIDAQQQATLLADLKHDMLYGNVGLEQPLHTLADHLAEATFEELLMEITANKAGFSRLFKAYGSLEDCLIAHEKQILKDLPKVNDFGAYAQELLQSAAAPLAPFIAPLLQEGSGTDVKIATQLQLAQQGRGHWPDIKSCFFTKDGALRARLLSKKTLTTHPMLQECFEALMAKLQKLLNLEKARKTAFLTAASLSLAHGFLALYEKRKHTLSSIDFDDIILKSLGLLESPNTAPMVLHHLSSTVSHILMDESQDTSPEQWRIIEILVEELMGAQTLDSFFAVGDEKQSIYSFQGASHRVFNSMHQRLKAQILRLKKPWLDIQMDVSYRSTSAVLGSVDAIFNQSKSKAYKVSAQRLCHQAHRADAPGKVHRWPLVDRQPLQPESDAALSATDQAQQALAANVAQHIKTWLHRRPILPATGQPIEPKDIMILQRRRSAFSGYVTAALKAKGIPVAGEDRLCLWQNLAIQDLYHLGLWVGTPTNDFSLAILLKSPLFRLDEPTLQSLCLGRGKKSIWAHLWENREKNRTLLNKLSILKDRAHNETPYAFYTQILNQYGLNGAYGATLGPSVSMYLGLFVEHLLKPDYETPGYQSLEQFLTDFYQHRNDTAPAPQHLGNCVQLLTVHGSKGLQAPIVILPDTTGVPKRQERFLWLRMEGHKPLVFFAPARGAIPSGLTPLLDQAEADQLAEYARLFYVALTRAQDHLFIGGIEPHQPHPDSWYDQSSSAIVWDGQETPPCPFTMDISPKTQETSEHRKPPLEPSSATPLPAFLLQSASMEASKVAIPITTLTPDQNPKLLCIDTFIEQICPQRPSQAPFTAKDRGTLLHKLLEAAPYATLPALQERLFSLTIGAHARPGALDEISQTLWRLHQHSQISALLAMPNCSEQPITGIIKGISYKGRVDRIVFDHANEQLTVIDYKTGAVPRPADMKLKVYTKQLTAYADLLAPIYPGYEIQKAIIWIDGPKLMFL